MLADDDWWPLANEWWSLAADSDWLLRLLAGGVRAVGATDAQVFMHLSQQVHETPRKLVGNKACL